MGWGWGSGLEQIPRALARPLGCAFVPFPVPLRAPLPPPPVRPRQVLVECVLNYALKTLLECVRLHTFGKGGLQQLQVDTHYMKVACAPFVKKPKACALGALEGHEGERGPVRSAWLWWPAKGAGGKARLDVQ